jgi:hypothetical protein
VSTWSLAVARAADGSCRRRRVGVSTMTLAVAPAAERCCRRGRGGASTVPPGRVMAAWICVAGVPGEVPQVPAADLARPPHVLSAGDGDGAWMRPIFVQHERGIERDHGRIRQGDFFLY